MSHSDDAIEREIVSKGLTAPRITPDDLKANIASEHYFTAADGVMADKTVAGAPQSLSLLTFCVLVLQNGFTVTGKSACASPENFDAEIGRKIARDDAIQQVWPLMGYALKEQLHRASFAMQESKIESDTPAILHKAFQAMASAPTFLQQLQKADDLPPHQQRVIDKKRELDEKLTKLGDFIDGTTMFAGLPTTEQLNLKAQRTAMEAYSCILADRIVGFGSAA